MVVKPVRASNAVAMKRNSLLVLAAFVFASLLSGAHVAHAASPIGVSLSPFQQTITLQPSDTERSFDLTLTNHMPKVQELLLSVRDFGSLNETGGLLFEGTKDYGQKYGLASWMTLGTDTVVLQPEQSQVVPVTIQNRQTLQPGGHYGAVVATVNSLDPQDGNRVIINQQLVSIVLVDKVGGEKYDLRLVGIKQNGTWFHLPTKVILRFQNPGNVHVVPRGLVQLVGPTGEVISQGIINSESAFVLPETFREIPVTLGKINGSTSLPGVYRIKVNYRYDGITTIASKQYLLRYVNAAGIAVVSIVVGVLLYYGYKSLRKRTVKKAQKPHKSA